MKLNTDSQHHDDGDQSELIGLSEINFLLVVALIALVTASANEAARASSSESPYAGEIVQLDTTRAAADEAESDSQTSAASAGTLAPTHFLQGAAVAPGEPVVIAVNPDFPLENIQFLIQKP